jgi:hypothetical protein
MKNIPNLAVIFLNTFKTVDLTAITGNDYMAFWGISPTLK